MRGHCFRSKRGFLCIHEKAASDNLTNLESGELVKEIIFTSCFLRKGFSHSQHYMKKSNIQLQNTGFKHLRKFIHRFGLILGCGDSGLATPELYEISIEGRLTGERRGNRTRFPGGDYLDGKY